MKAMKTGALVLPLAALMLGACAVPKVMISNGYIGSNKTASELLLETGSVGTGDSETKLFNYYVRVCDVDEKAATSTNCQDSLVLEQLAGWITFSDVEKR